MPSLPGFHAKGRLLYRRPLEDLLKACYFEDSGFEKNSFTVAAFVLPLYVPADHVHMTFGKRLGAGSGTWWDYAEDKKAEIGHGVVAVILEEALPMFDRFRNARDFFAKGASLVSNPEGVHLLEARACSAVRAGLLTDGKGVLGALEDQLAELDTSLDYVGDIQRRSRRLRQAVEQGERAAQAVLSEWRQYTIDHLGLRD